MHWFAWCWRIDFNEMDTSTLRDKRYKFIQCVKTLCASTAATFHHSQIYIRFTRYQPQSNKDWTWLLLILWGHLRSLLFHNDCLANGVHIKGTCMERKVDDVTRWIWVWTKLQALIVTKISRSGRCPPWVSCNNQISWFLTERRCWSWVTHMQV